MPEPVPEPVPVPALEDENLSAVRERKAEEEEEEEDVADAWINIMTTGIITNDSDLSTNQEPAPTPAPPIPAPPAPALAGTRAVSKKPNKVYNLANLDKDSYLPTTTKNIQLKTKKGESNIFSVTLTGKTSEFKLIDNDEQKRYVNQKFKKQIGNLLTPKNPNNAIIVYDNNKNYVIVTKNDRGTIQYFSQV